LFSIEDDVAWQRSDAVQPQRVLDRLPERATADLVEDGGVHDIRDPLPRNRFLKKLI
jgi:hypothetical protein